MPTDVQRPHFHYLLHVEKPAGCAGLPACHDILMFRKWKGHGCRALAEQGHSRQKLPAILYSWVHEQSPCEAVYVEASALIGAPPWPQPLRPPIAFPLLDGCPEDVLLPFADHSSTPPPWPRRVIGKRKLLPSWNSGISCRLVFIIVSCL